jgi:DNA repair protein RecN (Recombination protein N)
MLTCLRVRNFAIIDELEVEIGQGLNVVTGETGAGKSIVVDALELVLGGRGRPEVVRTGAEQAEVEALFDLDDSVRARLTEAGLEVEEELVVRRVLGSNGRSRAYVNGRMVTAAQLRDLTQGLADISSQHEHHSLVDARQHLEYLDAFGNLIELRARIEGAHDTLRDADQRLLEAKEKANHRSEREDFLRFQISEIDAVSPVLGEDSELKEERARLRHAEKLVRAAGDSEESLYAGDEAISGHLDRIIGEVSAAAAIDASLKPYAEQLERARAEIDDAARELGKYARSLSLDPDRLREVEDRVDALARLKKKYGGSLDRVLAYRNAAETEVADLDAYEDRLRELEAARAQALVTAREVALDLREKRRTAAQKLGRAVSKELSSLGMGDALVHVEVAPLEGHGGELDVDGARLTRTGIDRVEFLISPNRGEEARPLRKIASGGELSRALLAIKRVLAGLRPAGLYVFDEVDAGVGGAIAEVIGQKLHDVARHHQVLVITHLPQIAVFADAHYRAAKEVSGDRTVSTLALLGDAARLDEVARMLGGIKVTKNTKAAAAELLKQARVRA